jgi:23S rRNA (guanosine2251-2'-O)-methyltransferase
MRPQKPHARRAGAARGGRTTGRRAGSGPTRRTSAGARPVPDRTPGSAARRLSSEPTARRDREIDDAIIGRHAVREALRAGRPLTRLLIQEGTETARLGDIMELARERRVPVSMVPRAKLEALAEGRAHQGVGALAAAHPTYTEADLEDLVARAPGPPFWLILDGVQDPQNLGAILRVADGAGAHGVIIPARGAVGLTPVVDKVSSGAASWVPVVRVVNLARTVEQLQAFGLFVWAAVPDGERLYTEPDWTAPTALVIGAEGSGVRPLVRKRCDGTVRLPMAGHLESLNAATAAAVLAFEVSRQRLRQA